MAGKAQAAAVLWSLCCAAVAHADAFTPVATDCMKWVKMSGPSIFSGPGPLIIGHQHCSDDNQDGPIMGEMIW